MDLQNKYLSEYEGIKLIPNDQWLFFIELNYKKPPPTKEDIWYHVKKWLEPVSKSIKLEPHQLVWFARVENKFEHGKQTVPRHVHMCLHKMFLDSRPHRDTGKLWTSSELKDFLIPKWQDRHRNTCWIEDYNPKFTTPTGAGYCLKMESRIEDVFLSKGLSKLWKIMGVS